ncbi:unnamed protein product [Closterium sp. NIES-64]|nr:unnamed protein product [Closterium sp. NIES-64]
MLLDASRFCSLGCKLAAVPKDSTLTFVPRVASASGGHGAGCNGTNAAKRASAAGPATSHRANGYNAAAAGGDADTWREENGIGNASAAWVQKARTTGKKRVTPEVNTATSSPEISLLAASMEYDNIEDSFGGADSGRILVPYDDDDRLLGERDGDVNALGRPIRVFTYGAATPATPATVESDATATAGDSEREGGPVTAGGSQAADRGKEVADEFYEFTPADYSRLMAGKKEERFLKTKAIRDLEQQQRKAQFKQATIRVRFPDNTVVEAAFAPTDAVAAVRQFVCKCLLQPDLPFFFYTTPPKRRIKNEEEDLYTAQLTPGALLHEQCCRWQFNLHPVNINRPSISIPFEAPQNRWQFKFHPVNINRPFKSIPPVPHHNFPCFPPPLRNPPLRNPPLRNPPLRNPPLRNPPLRNPPLRNPPLRNPPLRNPPLRNPPLRNPPLRNPPLRNPPLRNPPLRNPPLRNPPLRNPPLRNPPLRNPPLRNPPLRNPPLRNPPLRNPPLRNPPLRNPPLRNPPLRNPPLRNPPLRNPPLRNPPLRNPPLRNPPLRNPPLRNPPLRNPPLRNPPLRNPPLRNPPLRNPPLRNPPLRNPPLRNPPLRNPPLRNPPLRNPPLRNPPLRNPPLRNPPLRNPPLRNPPLRNPPLRNPPLRNPLLRNPPLRNPLLTPPPQPPSCTRIATHFLHSRTVPLTLELSASLLHPDVLALKDVPSQPELTLVESSEGSLEKKGEKGKGEVKQQGAAAGTGGAVPGASKDEEGKGEEDCSPTTTLPTQAIHLFPTRPFHPSPSPVSPTLPEPTLDSASPSSLLHPDILALKDVPSQPELTPVEPSEGSLERKDEKGKGEVKQQGVAAGTSGAVRGASKAGLSSKPKWFKR